MNRTMTAEEIAAENERRSDERASHARRYVIDAMVSNGRFTREDAEEWVRSIEDAVRRDCARRCDAIRDEVDPDAVYAAPVLSIVGEGSKIPSTMPTPKRYRGARAGALLCAEAIREVTHGR